MPTFPRGFMNHRTNQANAKIIEKLCRETGGNIADERAKQRAYLQNPIDLRGIPAIGRGVQGAIRYSRPDGICNREAA